MRLALTPAAPWSDNGYGLVEQRQYGRPDRAGQRVESVHGVQAADIADGALAITSSLLDGVAQALELVGFAEHAALSAFAFTVAAPIARWPGAHRKGKRRDSRWQERAIAEQTTRIRVYLPSHVAPYGCWHSRSRQNRTGLLTSRGFKPPIEPWARTALNNSRVSLQQS
jgi:hypothetical protein